MIELVHGRQVRCELDGSRTYDRCAGICYLEGRDIAEAMVSAGLARDCPHYSGGRYRAAELQAAAQGATIRENTIYRGIAARKERLSVLVWLHPLGPVVDAMPASVSLSCASGTRSPINRIVGPWHLRISVRFHMDNASGLYSVVPTLDKESCRSLGHHRRREARYSMRRCL